MTRMLRLALLLTALLTLPIALIHAQPYTNPALTDILTSALDCETPCLMGLQPAVTTRAEAIARFEQAENINYVETGPGDGTSTLIWRSTVSPYSGIVYFSDGLVDEVQLQGARLYEVWFALGEPDGSTTMAYEMVNVGQDVAFNLPYAHIEYYAGYNLHVETAASCPRFWQQLVYITLTADTVTRSDYPTPLADRRRDICASQRAYQRLINP